MTSCLQLGCPKCPIILLYLSQNSLSLWNLAPELNKASNMYQILHLLCKNNYFGIDKECWLHLKGVQSLAIQFTSPAHLKHSIWLLNYVSAVKPIQDLFRRTEVCSWFVLNTLWQSQAFRHTNTTVTKSEKHTANILGGDYIDWKGWVYLLTPGLFLLLQQIKTTSEGLLRVTAINDCQHSSAEDTGVLG